MNDIFLLKD